MLIVSVSGNSWEHLIISYLTQEAAFILNRILIRPFRWEIQPWLPRSVDWHRLRSSPGHSQSLSHVIELDCETGTYRSHRLLCGSLNSGIYAHGVVQRRARRRSRGLLPLRGEVGPSASSSVAVDMQMYTPLQRHSPSIWVLKQNSYSQ